MKSAKEPSPNLSEGSCGELGTSSRNSSLDVEFVGEEGRCSGYSGENRYSREEGEHRDSMSLGVASDSSTAETEEYSSGNRNKEMRKDSGEGARSGCA